MGTMDINDLVNYIMAIVPSVVSVITVISSVCISIKNFKKTVHDDVTDMKELKREYKLLNHSIKEVLEENVKLKKIIEEQAKNFELLEMEINNGNQKQL